MPTNPTKLQLAYLKNLYYWTHGSKVLEEPFSSPRKGKAFPFLERFTLLYAAAPLNPTGRLRRPCLWWIYDRNR